MMNRRDAIRIIAITSAGILFPTGVFSPDRSAKSFHFIGLGDAGTNLLKHFYAKGIKGRFTAVNDTRSPDLASEVGFIRFVAPKPGMEIFGHRLYDVADITKDRGAAKDITALVEGDEIYIILAGLGKYTGSYLSMKLSGLLHQGNKNHFLLTTLPFSFEGKHVNEVASYSKAMISKHAKLLVYDLSKTGIEYGNIGLQDSFNCADESICKLFIDNFPGV